MTINVLVEGQTEELFVKEILMPFFKDKGIYMIPTIINTKVVKDGPNYKGGLTDRNFDRFIKDINRLVKSTPHGFVTTFIDFYALPSKFPGYNDIDKILLPINKVKYLEDELGKLIANNNFIPYIQLHEFETFLFVHEDGFKLNIDSEEGNVEELINIINDYSNPEDINNGKITAPSKRILKLYPSYEKYVEANLIVLDIGLENIISKCPHFKSWIDLLLSLSQK